MKTLAEELGIEISSHVDDTSPRLEDITDAKAFASAVLNSREFRWYIVRQLTLGIIPPALLMRLMDYGWGKPVERIEHTGKNGNAIETVTEVRRVIVRAQRELDEPQEKPRQVTH